MSNITGESILTTKEIVEQAIQDYHESILPYLNGQVPTIANKFDKANLYSTDEKIVGRWIDGKPLYQKTIDCGTMPNNETKNINHNISNIDKIIDNKSFCMDYTSGNFIPIPLANDTIAGQIWMSINRTKISIWTGSNNLYYYNAYVTIYYTKSTDSAVSIGEETEYSTDEKVIGTWIDGKLLYQKTVDCGGNNYQTSHGISNVSNIVSCFGIANRNSNNRYIPLPYVNTDVPNMIQLDADTSNIYIQTGTGITISNAKVTIQYTKTTD